MSNLTIKASAFIPLAVLVERGHSAKSLKKLFPHNTIRIAKARLCPCGWQQWVLVDGISQNELRLRLDMPGSQAEPCSGTYDLEHFAEYQGGSKK
jgi:hypothetical protein